jgi:hypothetical protein
MSNLTLEEKLAVTRDQRDTYEKQWLALKDVIDNALQLISDSGHKNESLETGILRLKQRIRTCDSTVSDCSAMIASWKIVRKQIISRTNSTEVFDKAEKSVLNYQSNLSAANPDEC